MKIIKPGRKMDPPVYRATCPTCGCEIELSHREMMDKPLPGYCRCPTENCPRLLELKEFRG